MNAILDIKNLCKDYGTLNILKNVNVQIEEGDFLVLVGPSGCGKSTLLNCIAGLESITSGAISIDGKDMTSVSPKDRDIAMVFQSYALYPTMSVSNNITFGMKVRGVDKAEREKNWHKWPNNFKSKHCFHASQGNYLAARDSVWPWVVHWFGIQNCFYLMNHFQILMQNCELKCGLKLKNCIKNSRHQWSMLPMIR